MDAQLFPGPDIIFSVMPASIHLKKNILGFKTRLDEIKHGTLSHQAQGLRLKAEDLVP